jgi:hypothetical protein
MSEPCLVRLRKLLTGMLCWKIVKRVLRANTASVVIL